MTPHDADFILYFSRRREYARHICWRVYHVKTGVETYHANVRIIGESETYYDEDGLKFLPGESQGTTGVLLIKGRVYLDET